MTTFTKERDALVATYEGMNALVDPVELRKCFAPDARCDVCSEKLTTRSSELLGWTICGALACRVAAVKRGQA